MKLLILERSYILFVWQVKFNAINIFNTSVNMSVKRLCKISSDYFCYVCGYYISPQQKKHKVTPKTQFFIAYEMYFGMKMRNQDKSWALRFLLWKLQIYIGRFGCAEAVNVCHLPFPEFGENQPIVTMTAISA